jgi:hypothetical protein
MKKAPKVRGLRFWRVANLVANIFQRVATVANLRLPVLAGLLLIG